MKKEEFYYWSGVIFGFAGGTVTGFILRGMLLR